MNLIKLKQDYRSGHLPKPEYISKMAECHSLLGAYSRLIPETDIEKIEITDNQVLVITRSNGLKLIYIENEKRTAPLEILNFDSCERHELEALMAMLRSDHVFFDIGANIGWYSLNVARKFPDIEVHAFEPISQTFQYLTANIRLNGLNCIKTHNFGLSNNEGKSIFYYYPEGSGNASMVNLSERKEIETITCQVIKLDTFAATLVRPPDVIKCDVEGAEFFVFQGAKKTLEQHRPIVFTELLRKWSAKYNYHPNDVIAMFNGMGYRCFIVSDSHLTEICKVTDETVETNFFFLHSKKHRNLIL